MLLPCPCCGYATLETRGDWEICPICFWEDDGQDDADAHEERGGPNRSSLLAGRWSFLAVGAAHEEDVADVRAPTAEDRRARVFRVVGNKVVEDEKVVGDDKVVGHDKTS